VAQLLDVLHRLRDEGNTVVVIEHNLDVIKTRTGSSISAPKVAPAAAASSQQALRKKWRTIPPHSPRNTFARCWTRTTPATFLYASLTAYPGAYWGATAAAAQQAQESDPDHPLAHSDSLPQRM
jgi:hypothetical protein